jgi:hypothetical protein
MKDQYADYEDMMRRKRQEQTDAADEELAIRKRIGERQDRLKKNNAVATMTAEEQEAMVKNYQLQLEQLDSAYVAEQRRQQLIMKNKMEMRQKRLIKVQQLKKELDKQNEPENNSKMTNAFAAALRKKLFQMDAEMHKDDDSELLRRLRNWDSHKHDYQIVEFMKKAKNAGLADLDEKQIKIMIIKLQQIEKLLKEVGKNKKLLIKKAQAPKRDRRRSTVSRSGIESAIGKLARPDSKQMLIAPIEERDDGSDESDKELISKQRSSDQLNATGKSSGLKSTLKQFADKNARRNTNTRK